MHIVYPPKQTKKAKKYSRVIESFVPFSSSIKYISRQMGFATVR